MRGAELSSEARRKSEKRGNDLLGYIAAEANHTKSKKLQKELDALYDRL
jgi:hypothetical protein